MLWIRRPTLKPLSQNQIRVLRMPYGPESHAEHAKWLRRCLTGMRTMAAMEIATPRRLKMFDVPAVPYLLAPTLFRPKLGRLVRGTALRRMQLSPAGAG